MSVSEAAVNTTTSNASSRKGRRTRKTTAMI